jgi:hypothetical protein
VAIGSCCSSRSLGDDWADATLSCHLAIGFRIIALVGDRSSWIDVRPKIEEHFKVAAVAGFAASQMEGDWITNEIGLEVDFRREAAP